MYLPVSLSTFVADCCISEAAQETVTHQVLRMHECMIIKVVVIQMH